MPIMQISLKRSLPLLTIVILGSLYITSVVNPARMDADLVVASLASLKNPTLYYWGQDRLFSLIPLLLLPLRGIEWNLYFNTFLQAAFFCTLILLVIRSITANLTRISIFTACSLLAINYIIPTPELFTFTKHAQPYAPSTAIILIAYFISINPVNPKARKSQKIACVFFATIALLLNPLTLIFGLSLPLAHFIVTSSDSWKVRALRNGHILKWGGILLPSVAILILSKHFYSQNYDINSTSLGISYSNFIPALSITIKRFIDSFHGSLVAIAIATVGFTTCLFTSLNIRLDRRYRDFTKSEPPSLSIFSEIESRQKYRLIASAAIINLIALAPIISSEWYQLNDYSLRYIFPFYFAIMIGICKTISYIYYALTRVLHQASFGQYPLARFIKPSTIDFALISALIAILIGTIRPISPSLLSYNEFSRVYPLYSRLSNNLYYSNDAFIGGSYWLSWPIKALGLRDDKDIGIITDRSKFDPVSRQREELLDDRIKKSMGFSFTCLSETPAIDDCRHFLSSKIRDLSDDLESWNFDASAKPIHFAIHGNTYATTMRYTFSANKEELKKNI